MKFDKIIDGIEVKKIKYKRKTAEGYKNYSRTYKSRKKIVGIKEIKYKKNFIKSYERLIEQKMNLISLEIVDGIYKLHYSRFEQIISDEDLIAIYPVIFNDKLFDTNILIEVIESMIELGNDKNEYKQKLENIIKKNSIYGFDSKELTRHNCYLLFSKEKFLKLIVKNLNVSQVMAQRVYSGIKNRVNHPYLYDLDIEYKKSDISSLKDFLNVVMIFDLIKRYLPFIEDCIKLLKDKDIEEDEKIDKIVDYVLYQDYQKYKNSKFTYQLNEVSSYAEFRKENYKTVYSEINSNSKKMIKDFLITLDYSINFFQEIYNSNTMFKNTINRLKELILPLHFYDFEKIKNSKVKYFSSLDAQKIKKGREDFQEIVEFEQDNIEYFELYKKIIANPVKYTLDILELNNYQVDECLKYFVFNNEYDNSEYDAYEDFRIINLAIDLEDYEYCKENLVKLNIGKKIEDIIKI